MDLSAEVREDIFAKLRRFRDSGLEIVQSAKVRDELRFSREILDVVEEPLAGARRIKVRGKMTCGTCRFSSNDRVDPVGEGSNRWKMGERAGADGTIRKGRLRPVRRSIAKRRPKLGFRYFVCDQMRGLTLGNSSDC